LAAYFNEHPNSASIFDQCGNFIHRIYDDVKTLSRSNRARAAQDLQDAEEIEMMNLLPAVPSG